MMIITLNLMIVYQSCAYLVFLVARLHLEKIGDGSVAVHWLCSTIDAKKLKIAIFEANDSLKTKGVLGILLEWS